MSTDVVDIRVVRVENSNSLSGTSFTLKHTFCGLVTTTLLLQSGMGSFAFVIFIDLDLFFHDYCAIARTPHVSWRDYT